MTGAALHAGLSRHPCYSHAAHSRYWRVHLPVASDCNLGCNYCERAVGGMSSHAQRPGVADRLLTPEEALAEVARHAGNPDLAVVGIAGPGEPLCLPETFEALRLVRAAYPELILCVSTNGLLLADHAERLRDLGVKAVTVTLNTVDPRIGEKIYAYVRYDGKVLTGLEGARLLLARQLLGIEEAARLGLALKINSVLIPGVNGAEDLAEVAKTGQRLGAHIQNITPLIPLGRFRHLAAPSCHALSQARSRCESIIRQSRLCRQCRADSVGPPGRDLNRAHHDGERPTV